jgi:hypothetical protein
MVNDPLQHLEVELERIDLLLHREILRLRVTYQLSLDEFRGLYVSDRQVDALIAQARGTSAGEPPTARQLTEQAAQLRGMNTADPRLPWARITREFSLTPFEQDLLLAALAPELDRKYETLYAYLNDDVTRKWPTRDLALRLFGGDGRDRLLARRQLRQDATLFAAGLLLPVASPPDRTSWLAGGFRVAAEAADYLLDPAGIQPERPPQPGRPQALESLQVSPELRAMLTRLPSLFSERPSGTLPPLLVFQGRRGAGRRQAAEMVSRTLGAGLRVLDAGIATADEDGWATAMRAAVLRQRLDHVGIYVANAEALWDADDRPRPSGQLLARELGSLGCGPVVLSSLPGPPWPALVPQRRCLVVEFDDLPAAQRRDIWEAAAARAGTEIAVTDLDALASRFVLSPGQITDAVDDALDRRLLAGAQSVPLPATALLGAARGQSGQDLGRLAVKVQPAYGWKDLVLPAATLQQVQEVAAAIAHRQVVYGEWGLARGAMGAGGLAVLFSGASGTGKTMAAGVIGRSLGLDLYKVDLSGVVSKYIGETEKNLDRIFRAAHASNAILFFDEADALFGRRSQVKDAHDRYANIEVAYLLQKLEAHQGAVILASNLSRNIDDAFSRRMHYVVEFPLPDEAQRERLWRSMFPSPVPLARNVDHKFLAARFPITGGDIRTVALDAAFQAAQDGRMVTMRHLVRATARQLVKQGLNPDTSDFQHYRRYLS